MVNPLISLSTTQWIQVIATIGQLGATIAAAVAAWITYNTAKEIKEQTLVMKKTAFLSYAPSLLVDWSIATTLEEFKDRDKYILHNDIFPETIDEINQQAPPKRMALELLHNWWSAPSRDSSPDRNYLIIQIHNTQKMLAHSVANDVNGEIKITIPKRHGHPREEVYNMAFGISHCQPDRVDCVPIKISGVPWLDVEMIDIKYNCLGEQETFNTWAGKRRYSVG